MTPGHVEELRACVLLVRRMHLFGKTLRRGWFHFGGFGCLQDFLVAVACFKAFLEQLLVHDTIGADDQNAWVRKQLLRVLVFQAQGLNGGAVWVSQ